MTDQREQPRGADGPEAATASGSPDDSDGDAGKSLIENPFVRWGVLFALGVLAVYGLLSGAVGWLFSVAVLAPVLVALVLSELDRDAESRVARVVAVAGLVVWLAVTGGLAMILVVGAVILMIFLHELGHYMAAKHAGMKVTEFFLGFGTRLWSFKRGETEFGLKAIPAGAYVKIIGMNNLEEVDPADEARTYRQAPFHSRFSVAIAGSAMHFALALVLLVVQFAAFGRVDDSRWVIGDLTEGGAAQQAGLRSGDQVVSFDGEPVGSFDEFRDQIAAATGEVVVEVERNGETEAIPVELIRRGKIIGTVGTDVDVLEASGRLFVGPLVEHSRGERAGLETGQRIVSVNGTDVESLDDLADAVAASEGGEVDLIVTGGSGGEKSATVDLGSAVATTDPGAFLGVGVENELQRESLPSAALSAVEEFGRGVGASVVGIATVFNPPRLVGFLGDTVTGGEQDVTEKPTPRSRSRCPVTQGVQPRSSGRSRTGPT
ncbi:MAG: site-2 protease family protein [Microthrixaceae bacterium]|nr:site-2 protease family protein [Microthrixaceae bacterium]